MQNGRITFGFVIEGVPNSYFWVSYEDALLRSGFELIDTSILHHAFISIFIALWDVITHYVIILVPILSYFTRFT